MTTKELAEWSGASITSLEKNKKRWCEKNLSKYADYELKRGGVLIKKIYNSTVFIGSGFKEVSEKYETYYGHDDTKVDTLKNCWNKLEPHMNNKLTNSTGIAYVGKARVEDYGVARKKTKRSGKKGYCHYVFGKIIDDEFYPFTAEEEEIKRKIWNKYFNNLKIEVIEEQQALNWALKHKEITVTEYAEQMSMLLDKETNWIDFQNELEETIQARTDFRIQIEKCAYEKDAASRIGFDF